MSYNPLNPNGQATMANSQPVVIASDQSAVPVSGTVTANLGTLNGAATSAKQDTGNTSVASIDTKTPALGQALAAASVPVVLPAAQITTLTPPAAITGFATETTLGGVLTTSDFDTKTGSLTEAAPASDTASSGLNGRLQRIAQRLTFLITALGSPFQAGGSIGNTSFASTQSGTWTVQPGNTANTTAWKVDASSVAVPVTDNASSLTVDAPVGTPAFVRLSDGTSAITTLPVSLASVPSHAVTNAGTFAVQAAEADGANVTLGAKADAKSTATDITAVSAMSVLKQISASVQAPPSQAVTNAGTFAVQAAQSGTWTVQPGNTANTTAWLVDARGNIAHGGVDSGNPVKIGAKVETSPKGITLAADAARTDLYADADGLQMVKLNTANGDLISERVSNTDGASTAFTNFSAVASTRNYITGFQVFRTDAGTTPIYVDFRDGTAGSILWSAVIPPNGGANNPAYCGPALFRTSAATALAYDVSAATSTVYISISGYQSKA